MKDLEDKDRSGPFSTDPVVSTQHPEAVGPSKSEPEQQGWGWVEEPGLQVGVAWYGPWQRNIKTVVVGDDLL